MRAKRAFRLLFTIYIGGIIMAYVISDECLSCGTCAANCPAEAISLA